MNSFIILPADRQKLLYEEGQAQLNLPAASIEKDFWVCWCLRELFTLPEWGPQLTFKGGTSLSKGWQLISRFSEDIDVVIDRAFLGFGNAVLSNNQQNKLIKKCSLRIKEDLLPLLQQHMQASIPTGLAWRLEGLPKGQDQQTLIFTYPSVFHGNHGYLLPVVRIELGARSETEPVEVPVIKPYLAKIFPAQLPESSFSLRTVSACRTFWEKAMLLHEETFRPADKNPKARLSRHYYDLWCLIRAGIAQKAVDTPNLFENVVRHRKSFFRRPGVDYETMRKGSVRLLPTPEQMAVWRRDYDVMRGVMFFEDPPPFDIVLAEVGRFQDEFNRI